MPNAPTINGQVIGQAHYATRTVLERLLAGTGTTFEQSVALNVAADGGGSVQRNQLVARMTGGLKIDDSAVSATVAELIASGLMEVPPGEESHVRLTDAGQALQRQIRTGIGEVTARLYGDFPAEDLATAGRVLTIVTERANAELG